MVVSATVLCSLLVCFVFTLTYFFSTVKRIGPLTQQHKIYLCLIVFGLLPFFFIASAVHRHFDDFGTATTLQNLDGSSGNNNNKDTNNSDNNNDKGDDMQQMPSLSTNELATTKRRMTDATFICNKNHRHHRHCHNGLNHRVL